MGKRLKLSPRVECDCSECVSACRHTPGWFRFGEAEKAAKLLKMTLPAFFRTYLGVNWWVDTPNIYVLAPATTSMTTGTEYPYDQRGACVFLTKDGKCRIHAAKPHECATAIHGSSDADIKRHKHEARDTWTTRGAQKQISTLLGRNPQDTDGSPWDLLMSGFF